VISDRQAVKAESFGLPREANKIFRFDRRRRRRQMESKVHDALAYVVRSVIGFAVNDKM
jgi:hypothetical protein